VSFLVLERCVWVQENGHTERRREGDEESTNGETRVQARLSFIFLICFFLYAVKKKTRERRKEGEREIRRNDEG